MIRYLKLELSRTLADGRYVLLAVVAPVGFYLLFASVFGGPSSGPNMTFGLPAATEIMVAMATFGAMWAALSATAPRLARDREGGWAQYLATTPIRAVRVLVARVAAALIVALPAVVAVGIAAVLAHGVRLQGWQWAAGLALLWIGTLPFVTLGIAIGSLANGTVSYALSTGRIVRFHVLEGDPERFGHAAGVTSMRTDGDLVHLYTSDADATVWSLYHQRTAITDLDVHDAGLEEAFLTLTAADVADAAQET